MQYAENNHLRVTDAIHDTIRIDLKFSDCGVIKLGNDAPALG